MPRGTFLLAAGMTAVLGCAGWPHWYRIPQQDTGLIGEWVGQPAWSDGDTVVWRFDAAGTAARTRWEHGTTGAAVSANREELGQWRVYDDSTDPPRRVVCFDYGRSRTRPPCWYYTIERRALKLMGQVGRPSQEPEVYEKRYARNR
jgi:hypothetical protein